MQSIQKLERWFSKFQSAIVAFSGGIDSSLVAFLARRYLGRDKCCAVIGLSVSVKESDVILAKEFASTHDIPLRIVETCEIFNPDYAKNPENRCFHCKSELYSKLELVKAEIDFDQIIGGENIDDRQDYRPGLKAVAEYNIRGPLEECGMTKNDVRAVARYYNLTCWDKPASPCLSSRIPYNSPITEEKLMQIDKAEAYMSKLGFPVSRIRHYGETAKVEVPVEMLEKANELKENLTIRFRELGFKNTEIDPEGFVSGKLNRSLKI